MEEAPAHVANHVNMESGSATVLGGDNWRFSASTLRRFFETECLIIVAIAGMLAVLAIVLPSMIAGDTWLALVDGRWVSQHGLPHADAIAVWTHGKRWIDQQWLAQVALYHVDRVGGVKLVLALGLVLDAAAIVAAAVAARLAGASARSAAIGVPIAVIVAPWALQARTQSFALPLFVVVYALLAADSRKPSRRVFLVLPILALWGNLHGSAILGVGLAVGCGLLGVRRRPGHGLLLALGAVASLVVSPYGFDLVGYYHTMLGGPLRGYVAEWHPTSLSVPTAAFFAAAFGTVWLLARRAKAVSVFERIALPLLLLAGLLAGRNTVWLGLAVAVSGPLLLDAEWRSETLIDPRLRRVNVRLSIVAIVIATVAITARLAQPEAGLLHAWPEAGASAVVAAAGPSGIVLSDDIHSDWLLWEKPVLIGRLAYDIRFELLDKAQFTKLRAIRSGAGGNRLTRQYKVLTFDPYQEAMPNLGRGRVVYRSPGFVVVREPG